MAAAEMGLMMATYLLLGFLVAGLMHGFMPRSFSERHLHPSTMGSVVKAALFGQPLLQHFVFLLGHSLITSNPSSACFSCIRMA